MRRHETLAGPAQDLLHLYEDQRKIGRISAQDLWQDLLVASPGQDPSPSVSRERSTRPGPLERNSWQVLSETSSDSWGNL